MASQALNGFQGSSSGHSDVLKLLSGCPGLLEDTMFPAYPTSPCKASSPLTCPASCSTEDCEEGPERPWYLWSDHLMELVGQNPSNSAPQHKQVSFLHLSVLHNW